MEIASAHGVKGKRNAAVDLVKFIAMIMVLGLHQYFGRKESFHSAHIIVYMCGIAMPLFFMVSGYLMTARDVDYKYVGKKILRILRFVVCMGVIYWLFYDVANGNYNPLGIIVISAESLVDEGPMSIFWFFGTMIIIYLLLPWINKLTNKYKAFLPSALAVLFVIVSVVYILNIRCRFDANFRLTFRLWDYFFYFLLGAAVRRCNILCIRVSLLAVLALWVVNTCMVYYNYPVMGPVDFQLCSVTMVMLTLLTFIFILQRMKKENRWIEMTPQLFLPVYALHPIYYEAYYKCIDTSFMGELSPMLDFAVSIVVLIAVSLAIMRTPGVKMVFRI